MAVKFLVEVRLEETNQVVACTDKRSSQTAAAERETGGLAGDRQGAWRRVRNVLARKFSGIVDRVLTIRAVGSTG
jgi:hypothetical protein